MGPWLDLTLDAMACNHKGNYYVHRALSCMLQLCNHFCDGADFTDFIHELSFPFDIENPIGPKYLDLEHHTHSPSLTNSFLFVAYHRQHISCARAHCEKAVQMKRKAPLVCLDS